MLQEIANQKGVSCRAQGWKVHLCAAQLLQLVGEVLAIVMPSKDMRRCWRQPSSQNIQVIWKCSYQHGSWQEFSM